MIFHHPINAVLIAVLKLIFEAFDEVVEGRNIDRFLCHLHRDRHAQVLGVDVVEAFSSDLSFCRLPQWVSIHEVVILVIPRIWRQERIFHVGNVIGHFGKEELWIRATALIFQIQDLVFFVAFEVFDQIIPEDFHVLKAEDASYENEGCIGALVLQDLVQFFQETLAVLVRHVVEELQAVTGKCVPDISFVIVVDIKDLVDLGTQNTLYRHHSDHVVRVVPVLVVEREAFVMQDGVVIQQAFGIQLSDRSECLSTKDTLSIPQQLIVSSSTGVHDMLGHQDTRNNNLSRLRVTVTYLRQVVQIVLVLLTVVTHDFLAGCRVLVVGRLVLEGGNHLIRVFRTVQGFVLVCFCCIFEDSRCEERKELLQLFTAEGIQIRKAIRDTVFCG